MCLVPVNILVAFLPNQRFALPANALDSCMNVGIPFDCAYLKTGKLEYPPTPKTALGLNWLKIVFTCMKLLINLKGKVKFFKIF